MEASAQVVVSDDAVARQAAEALAADLSREYAAADPGLRVEAAPCTVRETPMDWASTERAVCMLTCLPNGVQAIGVSRTVQGAASTRRPGSAAEQTALTATFCVRSSLGSQKEMLHRRLRTLMAQLGGTVSISGDYPAWEYRQDSSLRDLMTEVFQEQYGRKPKIEAIHAGVECGILSGKLPGLDCVSIGPNLLDIHTPRERMEIASVQRVWRFVLEVLKRSNRRARRKPRLHIVAGNPVVRGAVPWYNSRKAAGDGGNQGGNIMYHCFRLRRGQDLYEEIEAYVKAHHIAAGAVVSGVGCVSRWRLRDATGVRVRSGEEDVEIVSLMGTVSEYGCHLHASFSREDLSAFGGHLLPGCTVNTTAEIVLAEIRSCVFTRRPDSETGYEELEIGPAYPEETRNDRREER